MSQHLTLWCNIFKISMKNLRFFLFVSLLFSVFFNSSCRKDKLLTDGKYDLSFSTDTLAFDTVFTRLGSTTEYIRVFNDNNGAVNISNIRLGGGSLSPFTLNIDGVPGNTAQNIEVAGKDSFYVFATVTVDPTNQNNPLFFIDSVMFETNGNLQKVYLVAWGQDANFFISESIQTQTWTKDKPYVILNSLAIDSGYTLTIQPGTKIYFGGNSGMFVYSGAKIIAQGTCTDSILFRHVRLEDFFDDKAGQWLGIFLLRGSTGNIFEHVEISNATYGMSLGSCPNCQAQDLLPYSTRAEVTLKNSIIRNSLINSIVSISCKVTAENCLFYNAGDNMLSLAGGEYNFNYCTAVNYGSTSLEHKVSMLLLSNAIATPIEAFQLQLLNANFTNSIIYGSIEEEIDTSIVDPDLNLFRYKFDHCILKTKRNVNDAIYYNNCKKNEDPIFKDRSKDDYKLDVGSPAIDFSNGNVVAGTLDCAPRNSIPDCGCYEYQ